MKKVLLTTAPIESLIDPDGLGGNWYDRTDIYMSWTCAVDIDDRLSVSCPPTGLLFLKANVPDVEILQYPTWEEYRAALKSEKWDMVGISFYTWSTPVAIEMAKEAREAGVREIWGGNYGAITPGLEAHFTNLVKGPGEFVLHQYVYGRPLPRIHHPPMFGETKFRGITSPVGYLYSKRGCNIGCTFCSTPVFNPMEDAIAMAELQEALDAYQERKVAHVVIYDESFLLENHLGNLVIDGLAQRGLSWDCLTRSDLIHGRIGELTDRGMDGATIGIETFNEKHHTDVHKRDDVRIIRETIAELNHYGRRAIGTFMIGYPDDTIEEMQADVRHLAEEGVFVCSLTLLTPFHRTRLWREMEPLIDQSDLSQFDLYHLVWKHPQMSPSEARDVLAWAQRTVNDPDRMGVRTKKDLKAALKRRLEARGRTLPSAMPMQPESAPAVLPDM
jgi:pyruvate-formate lyase-activating enzyme